MNSKVLTKYIGLFIVSLICIGVFIFLEKNNNQYAIQLDTSKNLSEKSIHIIKELSGKKAVKFTAFTQEDTLVANKINDFFEPFKRVNEEIQVQFIDPVTNPSLVENNAISMQGEILLTFVDEKLLGKIHITELSESSIVNAMLMLQNNRDEWLVFAEGYGMSQIDDDSDTGLSQLLVNLKKQGFQIARMPLNVSLVLPDNVKVIVLPSPKELINKKAVQWLQNQMETGVSIWWLSDVSTVSQPYLELALDVMVGDKSEIVDGEFASVVSDFPENSITQNFNQPIYIAETKEIIVHNYQTLIESIKGAVLVANKELENNRIIVSGDMSFITNQYLTVAANKSFTTRLVDWLFYHDDRVNLPIQFNHDTQLYLSKIQLISLSIIFLLFIPLVFIYLAFRQWRAKHA